MALTIKEEMSAIDTKNRSWYQNLSDDDRKKLGMWVLMRYASATQHDIKDFEEHYLEWTNELVNVHFNTIRHHPELQFQLLQAVGLGKSMYHPWIAPGKRGTESKLFKFLREHYSHLNDDELLLFIEQHSDSEIVSLLEEFGLDKKKIKEITK